ncbi:unnamed protein product [Arabidopsis thaliana]|nr:unnamed protein product [Arabidopsis thaliana]
MIRPSSKVIIKFLIVMQKHGYIGEFEYVDDHRSGKIVVELNGRLNKCGVISPRFDVGVKEIEGWTARLLPSRQFGFIVLTTSAGIMDHEEARRKNVGGKVLGNCYPDCPPRWFIVSPITKQKLKPIPSITCQSSTVVSIGSKIYIIGGFVDGHSSRRLIVLDCPSHGWRRLPEMRVPRQNAAADVINDKIYVIGGSSSNNIEDWGEVYDPKTQTWELLLPTTLDLTVQMSVVPGSLVMSGKVYDMNGLKLNLQKNICLVEIENKMCQTKVWEGVLVWYEPEDDRGWCPVDGLEGLPNRPTSPGYLTSVAHSDRGRRVTVWWESAVLHRLGPKWTKECKTEIWCAEISFERRGVGKVCGFVEWSKNVFTKDDYKTYKLPASLVTY